MLMETPKKRPSLLANALADTGAMLTFSASRKLFGSPASGLQDATLALKANTEWFLCVAILPLVIALSIHPEEVFSNGVVTRIGYPGWCVGFDSKPGNYVAALLWQLVIYTGFLHVHWKLARVLIAQDHSILNLTWRAKAFIISANVLWLVGTMLGPISFMIPPAESMEAHYIPPLVYLTGRYLAIAGSFVEHACRVDEDKPPLPYGAVGYMIINTIATFGWMFCVSADMIYYNLACPSGECDGFVPLVPPLLTACFDLPTVLCLLVTPAFLPGNLIPVATTVELVKRSSLRYAVELVKNSPRY